MSDDKKPATKPEAQLAAATRAGGILAISPTGNLVRLPPGAVRLAVDAERGVHLFGLKDGWRLATGADFAKSEAAREADQANPRGNPSPKNAGA